MKNALERLGYQLDPKSQIWIRPEFQGIAYNDGDEVELRVGKIIDSTSDISVLSTELRGQVTDWPSLYHLSNTRANLLRPYKDCFVGDILEIGAGCGAITRYLGERGANVLALEGSPRRAAIARSRTRDLQNVTVLSEKFDQFKSDKVFDVITLIGVLEYANIFTPGDEPAVTMLRSVYQHLKPNGILIIAIENQLGLKYFAGAPEDHINTAMYGLEGRYLKDQPQTFGKKVLEKMLTEVGFGASQFMAPFPDYKLPVSIVTEAGFQDQNFDAAAFAWQSARRDPQLPAKTHFSLELAWGEVVKNGLGMDMANSFLIATSPAKTVFSQENALAYHYSSERLPPYCKETIFSTKDGVVQVNYSRLSNGQIEKPAEDFPLDFSFPINQKYSLGKVFSWEFIEIVSRDGWTFDEVGAYLKKYIAILSQIIESNGDGAHLNSVDSLIPGKFIDALPQNIVLVGDEPILFDDEWELKEDLTVGRLVFRALLYMLPMISKFGSSQNNKIISRESFIKSAFSAAQMNIDQQDLIRFIQLESKFQNHIFGRPVEEHMDWGPDAILNYFNTSLYIKDRDHAVGDLSEKILIASNQIAEQSNQIAEQSNQIAERDARIHLYESSRSWRITKPIRIAGAYTKKIVRLIGRIHQASVRSGGVLKLLQKCIKIFRLEGVVGIVGKLKGVDKTTADGGSLGYPEWSRQYQNIGLENDQLVAQKIAGLKNTPLISIVMPVYRPKSVWLEEAINSVMNQSYANWELCITDDASNDGTTEKILKRFMERDPRIKVHFSKENQHISAASNAALDLATGKWVALLDHDDVLFKHALLWIVDALNANPDAKLLYSDEAKIDESGKIFDPYFKPDWNRDLFYSHNMICHLGVYSLPIVKNIGGFRVGFEGAQDYDLALRFIEQIEDQQIHHIPRVLYWWRAHEGSTAGSGAAKSYAEPAGERALNEHFQRKSIKAVAEPTEGGYRVQYRLPINLPLVSLIIPTKNAKNLVRQCIESIVRKTTYSNYEIILVDNNSDDSESIAYFKQVQEKYGVKLIQFPGEFNYSSINNAAVNMADGEIIGLINNDIEVINPLWLSEMVGLCIQLRIGAVGAKLLYPDSSIQHAGIVLGIGGVAGHSHKHFMSNASGYFSRLRLINSCSAVTAACLLVRKSVFLEVGGLDERNLKVAFNDVDFCLRLKEAGYTNVWTPYAELFHHESATRGYEDSPEKIARFKGEVEYMKRRWEKILQRDPAYSPNLTLDYEDFSYAWPPRV